MEYFLLYRLIKERSEVGLLEGYNLQRRVTVVQRNQSLKKCRRELLLHYSTVATLKSEDDHPMTDRTDMKEICTKFYMNFFGSPVDFPTSQIHTAKQQFPYADHEVRKAMFQMKKGKAHGENGLNNVLVKAGGYERWKALVL